MSHKIFDFFFFQSLSLSQKLSRESHAFYPLSNPPPNPSRSGSELGSLFGLLAAAARPKLAHRPYRAAPSSPAWPLASPSLQDFVDSAVITVQDQGKELTVPVWIVGVELDERFVGAVELHCLVKDINQGNWEVGLEAPLRTCGAEIFDGDDFSVAGDT